MDKTTTWLIRGAAIVLIFLGIGTPIYLFVSQNRNLITTQKNEREQKLENLKNAMRQVAGRLSAGTSLRDSTLTFQPVIDSLAIAEQSHPDSSVVFDAQKASRLFDVLQTAWDTRIKAYSKDFSEAYQGGNVYNCEMLKLTADEFDRVNGYPVINFSYKKGFLGMTICKVPYGQLPEDHMYPVIQRILRSGANQ